MAWKFWKKEPPAGDLKKQKLPGPKELPFPVGKHLVVVLNLDPDWVWSLKGVTRRREENRKIHDIRIFDPAKSMAEGVKVKDYETLDGYPGQILFEGWYNNDSQEFEVRRGAAEKAA